MTTKSNNSKQEEVKALIDEARDPLNAENQVQPPKKRRGRKPKKIDPTPEEREEESIKHWQNVGVTAVGVFSAIIESKFPGCGPKPEQVEACSYSLGWVLHDLMPGEDERTKHWSAIIMTLVIPTGASIMGQLQERKQQALNGVQLEKKQHKVESN